MCNRGQRFINEQVENELIQEIGRGRASRRNDHITIYVLSDFNLENIAANLPGTTVNQVDAFQVTPEAGDEGQQSRWRLMEAVKHLIESGVDWAKLKQNQVAQLSGHSQSRISQIAAQFGGWKVLKKILVALLYPSIREANNLSEEEKWLSQIYLPIIVEGEEAIEELSCVIRSVPPDSLLRVLQAASTRIQIQVLRLILDSLPEEVQSTSCCT